jgi:hypothetical protein
MDGDRFDRLSRQIAGQADRRSIFKVAAGAALALVGAGVARREAAAAGLNGDICNSNAECGDGLTCENFQRGLLGGSLAGAPLGPPGVSLPLINGRSGRCRYRNGCGGDGDLCQNNSDCCGGFSCPNNRCRRQA